VAGPKYGGYREDELSPIPEGIRVSSNIEGLVGEERRLIEIADHERSEHDKARLKAVQAELDRAFEHLKQRPQPKRPQR
jgi:Protein of unknown function (DUF2630)